MTPIVLAEVASTNDWLLARAGALADLQWVRAIRQTAGRGRRGRSWASHPDNLAASVLVLARPSDPPAAQLALVAGVALFEAAGAHAGRARLMLKWPNDLLMEGAKLAGILAERQGEAVVIGFGVNLAHAPDFPDRPTIALGPPAPGPAAFLDGLAWEFARWLGAWRQDGLAPVRAAWEARAHPPGTLLSVAGPPQRLGRFRRLCEDGALELETDEGLVSVHGGEVALLATAETR